MREFRPKDIKKVSNILPTFSGRPKRDFIIQKSEILDLKIVLEVSKDVLDVIEDKYLFST